MARSIACWVSSRPGTCCPRLGRAGRSICCTLARLPLFLPETMLALRALERFKQTGIQVALLVDEYGSIDG